METGIVREHDKAQTNSLHWYWINPDAGGYIVAFNQKTLKVPVNPGDHVSYELNSDEFAINVIKID